MINLLEDAVIARFQSYMTTGQPLDQFALIEKGVDLRKMGTQLPRMGVELKSGSVSMGVAMASGRTRNIQVSVPATLSFMVTGAIKKCASDTEREILDLWWDSVEGKGLIPALMLCLGPDRIIDANGTGWIFEPDNISIKPFNTSAATYQSGFRAEVKWRTMA